MDLLESLNKAQREAVTTTEGPVMVMAGAGSGKTKVLTTRISYLIDELGVSTDSILAVTFTNKAAREMKERIERMLNRDTKHMWISTFHSFCCRLLRMEIHHLDGYTNSFMILDEEDSLKVVRDIMKAEEIDEYKPKEIRNLISKSKNFTDFNIKDPYLNDKYMIISKKYEEKLKLDNLLDFDDLIIKVIDLFKKNPNILEKYQRKFQYILVDEFQDTNTLQYNLMFMLSARFHNIFVVGDDFQSIYSFRGAKIENINHFRRDFRETKLILLEQNYRSTTQILDLANCVIKHNPNQIKKVMFSETKEGTKPYIYRASSAYDEVMFVTDKIKSGLVSGKKYSDFAIMYRANYISRNFEDAFIKAKIPYRIYGGVSFFSRMEVKDVIAYIRLVVNPMDNFSFDRVVNVPKRKVGPKVVETINAIAYEIGMSKLEALDFYNATGVVKDNLTRFKEIIDSLRAQLENIKLKDLVDMIIDETGYDAELRKEEDTYEDRINNLRELKSVLAETEEFYEGTNFEKLEQFLSDLALRTDNENEGDEENTVKLTTYHQAKGLEFDTVFMVATEEGIFPSQNSETNKDIEEERRICYVGVTRAKRDLYITCCENRFLFGSTQSMMQSRFIKEMDEELYIDSKKKKSAIKITDSKPKSSISKPATQASDSSYSIGDKINHKAFGDGLVVGVAGGTITVAFPMPTGIKKLQGNHPAIRKI